MTEDQEERRWRARWAAILADQAGRGADPATIRLIGTRSTVWRTGSLGRDRPGHRATQALVPGTVVEIEVEGRAAEYRFGAGDIPVLVDPGH